MCESLDMEFVLLCRRLCRVQKKKIVYHYNLNRIESANYCRLYTGDHITSPCAHSIRLLAVLPGLCKHFSWFMYCECSKVTPNTIPK